MLTYKGDYEELLRLREHQLKKYPNDPSTQERWAEVLILTKQYDRAIAFLTPLHEEEPEDEDVVHHILDALKGKGMKIEDYDWVVKPRVIMLNEKLINLIADLLKRKRNGTVNEIHTTLFMKYNYLDFTQEELYDYIVQSQRFEVDGKNWYDSKVEIKP